MRTNSIPGGSANVSFLLSVDVAADAEFDADAEAEAVADADAEAVADAIRFFPPRVSKRDARTSALRRSTSNDTTPPRRSASASIGLLDALDADTNPSAFAE